jgi:hypothetical protein
MKITRGKFEPYLRMRILPSIEFSNYAPHGLTNVYGNKYDIMFRWLHYYIYIEFGGSDDRT